MCVDRWWKVILSKDSYSAVLNNVRRLSLWFSSEIRTVYCRVLRRDFFDLVGKKWSIILFITKTVYVYFSWLFYSQYVCAYLAVFKVKKRIDLMCLNTWWKFLTMIDRNLFWNNDCSNLCISRDSVIEILIFKCYWCVWFVHTFFKKLYELIRLEHEVYVCLCLKEKRKNWFDALKHVVEILDCVLCFDCVNLFLSTHFIFPKQNVCFA